MPVWWPHYGPDEGFGPACTLPAPVFASRFPYEPGRYEGVPDELPGLWPSEPEEPGELMVPAI